MNRRGFFGGLLAAVAAPVAAKAAKAAEALEPVPEVPDVASVPLAGAPTMDDYTKAIERVKALEEETARLKAVIPAPEPAPQTFVGANWPDQHQRLDQPFRHQVDWNSSIAYWYNSGINSTYMDYGRYSSNASTNL